MAPFLVGGIEGALEKPGMPGQQEMKDHDSAVDEIQSKRWGWGGNHMGVQCIIF